MSESSLRPLLDPAGYSLESLAGDVELPLNRLLQIAGRIDRGGYSRFVKRNDPKKRVFAAPVSDLKAVQRKLADQLFSRLDTSENVYSRKGRDVVRNARRHVAQRYHLSLDLADCYPSTTLAKVRAALYKAGFRPEVRALVARLVTYNGRLPQGAPSSNAVLDCVLHGMDEALAILASEHGCVYTRFVDDLSFSGDVPLHRLRRRALKIIRAAGYSIRHDKTRYSVDGKPHIVTGVVVSEELHAPTRYLGDIKRDIVAYSKGSQTYNENSLFGRIAWVRRLNDREAAVLYRQLSIASQNRLEDRLRDSSVG